MSFFPAPVKHLTWICHSSVWFKNGKNMLLSLPSHCTDLEMPKLKLCLSSTASRLEIQHQYKSKFIPPPLILKLSDSKLLHTDCSTYDAYTSRGIQLCSGHSTWVTSRLSLCSTGATDWPLQVITNSVVSMHSSSSTCSKSQFILFKLCLCFSPFETGWSGSTSPTSPPQGCQVA